MSDIPTRNDVREALNSLRFAEEFLISSREYSPKSSEYADRVERAAGWISDALRDLGVDPSRSGSLRKMESENV